MTQNDSVMQLSQSIAIRRKRRDQSGSWERRLPCPYSLTIPYLIPYGMASQQLQLAAQAPYASFRKRNGEIGEGEVFYMQAEACIYDESKKSHDKTFGFPVPTVLISSNFLSHSPFATTDKNHFAGTNIHLH